MRVSMLRGQFVQVQQSLVDVLLQLQGALHGLQPTPPLITLRFLRKKKHSITADCTLIILSLVYTGHNNVSHQYHCYPSPSVS